MSAPISNPIYYENQIFNHSQTVSKPVSLYRCNLLEGVNNKSALLINKTTIRGITDSVGQSFTARDSTLEDVKATHDLTLTGTPAKTVKTTQGILSVSSCKRAYVTLEAPRIVADDIAASDIICTESIKAKKCTFGSVKSGNMVRIKDSIIRESLQVQTANKQRITLRLKNTVIDGDVVIQAPSLKKVEEEIITLNNYNFKGTNIGKLNLAKGAILTYEEESFSVSLSKKYSIFEEIPEDDKAFFVAISGGEGKKGMLGDFECIVKNGKAQLYIPEPEPELVIDNSLDAETLTLSILKQRLEGLYNNKDFSVGNIECMGGIFKMIGGKLCMIKAPPALNLVSHPFVKVKIIGGFIKGKILFKDCHGYADRITNTITSVSAAKLPQAKLGNNNNNANISVLNVPAPIPEEKQESVVEAQSVEQKQIPVFPDDPNDDDFMDPITLDRITNPYRTPTKPRTHAFEYDSLVLLCHEKDHFTCPLTDEVFKLADCKPDHAMKAHIEKLLAEKE